METSHNMGESVVPEINGGLFICGDMSRNVPHILEDLKAWSVGSAVWMVSDIRPCWSKFVTGGGL